MFDDRLEIFSPGGLVDGVTEETMLVGMSETRNNNLAKIFYRLEYIEAYGTGIPRIMNDYELFNCKPTFKIFDSAFCIIIPNKLYGINSRKKVEDNSELQLSTIFKLLDQKTYVTKDDVSKELNVLPNRAYVILEKLVEKDILYTVKEGRKKIYYKK